VRCKCTENVQFKVVKSEFGITRAEWHGSFGISPYCCECGEVRALVLLLLSFP
jgi:hypothetical protein